MKKFYQLVLDFLAAVGKNEIEKKQRMCEHPESQLFERLPD